MVCLIGSLWRITISPVALLHLYDIKWDAGITSVANEREHYFKETGLISLIANHDLSFNSSVEYHHNEQINDINNAITRGASGHIIKDWLGGMIKYYIIDVGNDIALTDNFGLMDPLLSHLPARKTQIWRVGHLKRDIPSGYKESLESGSNRINNSDLHKYYDMILEITSGDLTDLHRLRVIYDFNTGKYEYLKNNYLNKTN